MHKSINNLIFIQNKLKSGTNKNFNPEIIAVSKTFLMGDIKPLINYGHIHFGENKVQEAVNKWQDIKNSSNTIKLHMIGKLQTNKVKDVIPIFDYIHSLDNLKLAEKISKEQQKKNKYLKIFIQINIGNEKQKNGIMIDNLKNFYNICVNDLNLNIVGLMCIPPQDNVETYFKKMKFLKDEIKLSELSMGMSGDYMKAVDHGSTFLRIGSKIFGERS